MANVYGDFARLLTLDTPDIFTFNDNTDADSGLRPIRVARVVYMAAAGGDTAVISTLRTNSTPTLAVAADTYTVTSTYRITDVSSGAVFNGATAGDWAHIKLSSSGNNKGWYLITAVDASKHYIDVAYGTRPLTDEASKVYTIDIFTPEVAMRLRYPGAILTPPAFDLSWRPGGRFYSNLALASLSASSYVDVYLE